jgi:hypothetical protein
VVVGGYQPKLDGPYGSLGTIGHTQLADQVFDMCLDRTYSQAEGFRDLAVGLAEGDEAQHIVFTAGQVLAGARLTCRTRQSTQELEDELGVKNRLTGEYLTHGADDLSL